MMKLAVFTVMLPDLNPEEAAKELKAAGYDGVEWRVSSIPETLKQEPPSFWGNNLCSFSPTLEEAQRAKTLSGAAGLATPNIGTYIALGDLEAVQQAMSFAQTLGCPQFRVSLNTFSGNYARHFADAKAFLADVESLVKAQGLKALLEIHHRSIIPSASAVERLVSHFDPRYVGVIHDAGNMVHEGFEDYLLGLEILGPYLAHVHIKNARFEPQDKGIWKALWSPLENGVVDFYNLFSALKAVGYEGWLALEDFSQTRPSREALRHNLAFIKTIWEAV